MFCFNKLARCGLLTILAISTTQQAFAADSRSVYDCIPSKEIDTIDTHPGTTNVPQNNNLRRKTGTGFYAKGEKIFITGRILDEKCIPVQGAKVQIWQANHAGYFLSDAMPAGQEDPHFSGSGETYTNNFGEYTFITIVPGKTKQSDYPFINIAASKEKLGVVRTRMYLLETGKNTTKKTEKNATKNDIKAISNFDDSLPPDTLNSIRSLDLKGKDRGLVAKKGYIEGTPTYSFDITLPHEQIYRIF